VLWAADLTELRHSLVVLQGRHPGTRVELTNEPLVLGRRTASDLVLPELLVSALHCRVQADANRPALRVTDLKSTNGTFVNGQRITGSAYLLPGGTLAVGEHVFRHDFLVPDEPAPTAADELEPGHAAAWLPSLMHDGPLRTDWCHRPATPPRGAGFVVLPLARDRFGLVLVDVCGPGPRLASHAATVLRALSELRDLAGPAQLFAHLNKSWPMVDHGGLFITAWAAVYDPATRRLSHGCAGQHAALLRVPGGEMQRLDVLNPPLGLLPEAEFAEQSLAVAPGSRLRVFNKGAFDVMDRGGRRWELDDFEAMLAFLPATASGPEQVFTETRRVAESLVLEDDFLLLQADFV
jgi:hypothetical protein